MYQCQFLKKNAGALLSACVIILSSLCAFGISEYCYSLQFNILHLTNIPYSFKVLFKMSSSITAIVPLMIYVFLFFTSNIMFNSFFEEKVSKRSLLTIIGISYIPMLIYQYTFWFNLLFYCQYGKITSVEEFICMKYMFGFKLQDFQFINLVCWGLIYLIIILYYILNNKNVFKTILSVLFPSFIVILTYYFIISIN